MKSLQLAKLTNILAVQPANGSKTVIHPNQPAAGETVGKNSSYQQATRSFFYYLLAGNLVGYFLSVTIVSIFLGLWFLAKNYSLITSFSLLKTITFSFEKIFPLFSQVIFSLLAISLLLVSSLSIYSIIRRYLFNPRTKTSGKFYGLLITLLSGYFLFALGQAFKDLWHKPLLCVSINLSKLLAFTYEKLVGISYDVSLGLLILMVLIFFFILRKLFGPPTIHARQKNNSSVTDVMPILLSIIQAVTIVGIILIVNTLLLGIILAITIKKTLLFYYLILGLGLGMAYLIQELFILKHWQRPIGLGVRLSLVEMYVFICLALEGTTIKLLQLLA